MEIELKYSVPDEATADAIWNNKLFKEFEEFESREESNFEAKYFDTELCDLAKKEIAYRVRKEDDVLVASLKWKGHSEDGLHVREEINVPVDSDEPEPDTFKESKIGKQVKELLCGKDLICLLETKVFRRSFRIDTGKALCELSIDRGEIITKYGTVPISEVEIELFSGETDELLELGKKIQKEYKLIAEDDSKYARGIEMIKKNS